MRRVATDLPPLSIFAPAEPRAEVESLPSSPPDDQSTADARLSDLLDQISASFESDAQDGPNELVCEQLLQIACHFRERASARARATAAAAVAGAEARAAGAEARRLRLAMSSSQPRVLPAADVPIDILRAEVSDLADALAAAAARAGLPAPMRIRDADFEPHERRLYLTEQKMLLQQQLIALLERRLALSDAAGGGAALVREFGSPAAAAQAIADLRDEVSRLRLREQRFALDPLLSRAPGPAGAGAGAGAAQPSTTQPAPGSVLPDARPPQNSFDDVSIRVLVAALQNELSATREAVAQAMTPTCQQDSATGAGDDRALEDLCNRIFQSWNEPPIQIDVASDSAKIVEFEENQAAMHEQPLPAWAETPTIGSAIDLDVNENLPLLSHISVMQTQLMTEIAALRSSLDAHARLADSAQELRTLVLDLRGPTKSASFNSKSRIIAHLTNNQVFAMQHIRRLQRIISTNSLTIAQQQGIINAFVRQKVSLERRSVLQANEISDLNAKIVELTAAEARATRVAGRLADLAAASAALLMGGPAAAAVSSNLRCSDSELVRQAVRAGAGAGARARAGRDAGLAAFSELISATQVIGRQELTPLAAISAFSHPLRDRLAGTLAECQADISNLCNNIEVACDNLAQKKRVSTGVNTIREGVSASVQTEEVTKARGR